MAQWEDAAQRVHHDHTGAIRARLAHLAVTGLIGLLLAAVAAVVILVIGRAGAPAPGARLLDPRRHRRRGVGGDLGGWLWSAGVRYRRRRADLDAQGAEAMGELPARLANSRRRHRP